MSNTTTPTTLQELGFKVFEKKQDGGYTEELRLQNGDLVGSYSCRVRMSDGEAIRSMHVSIIERRELSPEQLTYVRSWEARQRNFELP